MKLLGFIYFSYFLVCALPQSTGQSDLICSPQPVVAQLGEDVILPCHLHPSISAVSETVEWTKPNLEPKSVHLHKDGRLVFEKQNPSYSDRTRLFVDELKNGNVSLKIFQVKLSDEGEYRCTIPTMHKEASVNLIVEMTVVIGSREPVIGKVGQDVILPCHLKPPFDVRNLLVVWRHNEEFVHVYRNMRNDFGPQHQQFKGRTSLFRDELVHGNISLKLTNVTKNDAGDYTCFVPKLHSQVKKGSLSLEVVQEQPNNNRSNETSKGEKKDDKGPMIGGIIGGVLVGGLLVLAAVLIWKQREERRPREGHVNPEEGIELQDQPPQPTDNPQELNDGAENQDQADQPFIQQHQEVESTT